MEEQFKIVSTSGKEVFISARTVEFLQELSDARIREMEDAVDLMNFHKRLGTFARVVLLTIFGLGASIFTIWSALVNIKSH